ncbi:MAG: VOC family protein [Chloroflexota bacterium]|nr:VOC family protein [Chloroflexota bacterium]|tara:strand:- start:1291 stop:1473 length:183 start_codon:yes stop_codon:yes gene_type:complete
MAFKLNHVHLKAPDPQKTAQFYVTTLGANILEETTVGNGRKVCFFEGPDGVHLEFLESVD